MSPASLVLAVAAGLAGTALLAVPVVRPALPPARSDVSVRSAAVRGAALGPRAAVGASPVAGLGGGGRRAVILPTAPMPHVPASAVRFRWPLSPAPPLLRRFAVGPQRWSAGHRGVDLGGTAGQPVLAAGPGIVAFAGLVAGRGVVTVAHEGGLRTTYEPVIAAVKVGRTVTAGDELGVLAAGAHCPAACLHWGALRGDVYVDPLTLLRPPAPPVLLPLPRGPSP